MTSFVSRKIDSQKTLAEILKGKREELNLDWPTIEKHTKINKKHLQALEKNSYEELPADIYVKNFLNTYAAFLDLDKNKLSSLYLKEKDLHQKTKTREQEKTKTRKRKIFITPRLIRNTIVVLVVIVLLSYLGWEVKSIFTPPFLQINTPENNLVISETSIIIEGQTEKEVEITINGQGILSDNNGYFEKTVNLQEGLNIIEISAKRKHSKENTAYRQIMVNKQ